jgi:Sulfotransferase family
VGSAPGSEHQGGVAAVSDAHEELFMRELREVRSTGRRRPDFFIVGHAKCGTTALYKMLQAHPQVYLPALKEPHFLAREPQDSARPRKRRPVSLAGYLSLFEPAQAGQIAGDASTSYLRSAPAARRIASLQPDARIIALLREPAEFLSSLHLQLLQNGVETERDFAAALALEQPRRRGMHLPGDPFWARALLYSEHVHYVAQLRRFHEALGRDRVLVLIYDDLRNDNESVVRRVLRFLEVDDSIEIATTDANPTVRVRSRRAEEMLGGLTVGRGGLGAGARLVIKGIVPQRARRRLLRGVRRAIVEREPTAPPTEVMSAVRRRFKGDVVAASDYLERDLVGLWGYDEVP